MGWWPHNDLNTQYHNSAKQAKKRNEMKPNQTKSRKARTNKTKQRMMCDQLTTQETKFTEMGGTDPVNACSKGEQPCFQKPQVRVEVLTRAREPTR